MRWSAIVLAVLGFMGGRLEAAHACDNDPGSYDFLSGPRVSYADSRYVVIWNHDRADGELIENSLEARSISPSAGDMNLGPLGVHARLCDRVIGSSGDGHLVVGTRQRTENSHPVSDIVTLGLDLSGTATGPATMLTSVPYLQRPSGIAFNGDHFLVVGEGSKSGATTIFGLRLDRDGEALDANDILQNSLDQYVWVKPRVASARGQFLVAWTVGRYSGGDKVGLYAVRVSGEGEILDRRPLFEPVSARVNAPAALASSGTEYFAVWADETSLYSARITTEGEMIMGAPLAAISHPVFSLDVAWTGDEYVVTWTSSGRIRAIRVSNEQVASEPVELTKRGSESSTACGPVDCMTAWTEWKGGSSDIVALHLERNANGTVNMNANEIVIARAEGTGCSISAAGSASGSASGSAATHTGLPVALALLLVAFVRRRRASR